MVASLKIKVTSLASMVIFGEMWRGLPVTKDGQVWVIETINPEAPMTKDSQSAFDEVVRFIVDKRSK